MIYFIFIYLLVCFVSFTDFSNKYNKIGSVVSILLLSMLAGFRNTGGKDFEIYRLLYNTGLSIGNTEIGYTIINKFFSNIGVSYNIFLFIISFISIFLLMKAFESCSVYPKLSLLLYMGTYFLFYNVILNRQMLAVALLLWIIYLWNRNKIYSLLLLSLAFSFHKSIIIILPFLIIFDFINKNKFLWLCCLVIGGLLAFFINPEYIMFNIFNNENSMINLRLGGYILGSEGSSYSVEIFEYIKLFIMLVIIIPIWKILLKDTKVSIYLFLYIVGCIFLIWSSKYEIMFRLFMYFDLSFIILLPYSLKVYMSKYNLSNQQQNLVQILSYCIIGFIAICSIYYRVSNFGDMALVYQFYFMENL